MKTWMLPADEQWICDRFKIEWDSTEHATKDPNEADVLWLASDWRWRHVDIELLKRKKVVVTCHHFVPSKFGPLQISDFIARDAFVDAYHVPCLKTKGQLLEIFERLKIDKPIFCQPFWVNDQLWRSQTYGEIGALRSAMGFDRGHVVISSFQRDTEGSDLISPKLEKGPDIFCDTVESLWKRNQKIRVLLAGWRRQYVINRLKGAKIPYTYIERPADETINQLYSVTDLYIVGSRFEGGPQSIVECAITHTPIVSKNVGVASEILHPSRVGDDLRFIATQTLDDQRLDESTWHACNEWASANARKLCMPHGFKPFADFFNAL